MTPARSGRSWFRNGRWLIVPVVLVTALTAVYQIGLVRRSRVSPRVGDGRHVETYRFDLGTCTVSRALIAASGLPRDGLPRLDFPALASPREVSGIRMATSHAKYLVSSDRVIGVAVNGVARAYPLRVMTWHEVVNDTLGGAPICVTYSPHADASVVFDRRREASPASPGGSGGPGGRATVRELAFSGLVYNADLLMFDRGETAGRESLYSQLLARAVAGPGAASNETLAILPFSVETWGAWQARHPATTVVRPDPAYVEEYGSEPYGNYYGNDLLPDFPVEPTPPAGLRRKELVLGLAIGAARAVVPESAFSADVPDAERTLSMDGHLVRVTWHAQPATLRAELVAPAGATLQRAGEPPHASEAMPSLVAVPAFWFAWHAMYPDDRRLDAAPLP